MKMTERPNYDSCLGAGAGRKQATQRFISRLKRKQMTAPLVWLPSAHGPWLFSSSCAELRCPEHLPEVVRKCIFLLLPVMFSCISVNWACFLATILSAGQQSCHLWQIKEFYSRCFLSFAAYLLIPYIADWTEPLVIHYVSIPFSLFVTLPMKVVHFSVFVLRSTSPDGHENKGPIVSFPTKPTIVQQVWRKAIKTADVLFYALPSKCSQLKEDRGFLKVKVPFSPHTKVIVNTECSGGLNPGLVLVPLSEPLSQAMVPSPNRLSSCKLHDLKL